MESKVTFYLDKVLVKVGEAAEQSLLAIAHQIEGQAKANIVANDQVDTGFMLNAVYVTAEGESNYGEAQGAASARNTDAEMAPEEQVKPGQVAVVAGANYAIYQEAQQSFLFRAGEQVAGSVAGAIVEKVGREVI
jgi:hypothetical protein